MSKNDFHIKMKSTDMCLYDKTYNIYYAFMFYLKIKYLVSHLLVPRFNLLQGLAFLLLKLLNTVFLVSTINIVIKLCRRFGT